ncbi:MAG: peptidoglycan editing factor PgeF [Candidatus Azobacteroides sp.]|nr:peptidoglycan editing factor PgeF [Candidatus Azobacteroides sp.]
MKVITYKNLAACPGLVHFTTTREGGVSKGAYSSLNLSPYSGDSLSDVAINRKRLAGHLGISPENIIVPYQTHEDKVCILPEGFETYSFEEKEKFLYGNDALITNFSDFCIGVTTADCTPLLLFDPNKKVIAVIHAGWRGTVKYITEKTIATMISHFDCIPEDISAAIGPCISKEVYEVGKEVYHHFKLAGFPMGEIAFLNQDTGKYHIDLVKANEWILIKSGVKKNNIETSGICTYTCSEHFFSARKSGIRSGRFLSGIMLNY